MLNLCLIIETLNILGPHHILVLVSMWVPSVDCCFRYFGSSFGFNQFWNAWTLKRCRPLFLLCALSPFITSSLLVKCRENYFPDQSILVSRAPAIPILPCCPENFIRIGWFLFIPIIYLSVQSPSSSVCFLFCLLCLGMPLCLYVLIWQAFLCPKFIFPRLLVSTTLW